MLATAITSSSSWKLTLRVREERQHDAQEAVGADLRQHAREHRDHRRRRGSCRRRASSACSGKAGIFTRNASAKQQEDPFLRALRQPALGQLGELERTSPPVGRREDAGRDRRGQHQQAPDQRVDHERGRRAHAVRAAPDADQEVERHQHQVEEQDEQRQVLRAERAQHRGLAERQHQVVEARAASHARAAASRRRRGDPQQRGQQRSGTG